jgi:small subunit ribosomal protein S17
MTLRKGDKFKRAKLHGIVVSNKMEKTVRVLWKDRRVILDIKRLWCYRKIYFAHTDKELNEGDKVVIQECRPFSKNVKWIVKI